MWIVGNLKWHKNILVWYNFDVTFVMTSASIMHWPTLLQPNGSSFIQMKDTALLTQRNFVDDEKEDESVQRGEKQLDLMLG